MKQSTDDIEYENDSLQAPLSKTQRKRDMHERQLLGQKLCDLNNSQLALIPLSEDLLAAIAESHRIKSHEAKRRHLQYIGKLMRKHDVSDIEQALNRIEQVNALNTQQFHLIERWRDELLAGDDAVMAKFIDQYPNADRNGLRQLIRQAKKQQALELDTSTPQKKGAKLKLFRFIKDTMEQAILSADPL